MNSNSAVGSAVSPQNECPNPNLWYLGMWLYLEIGPCRGRRVKMRSSRWAFIQWLVSWQKEKGHMAWGSGRPGSTNDFWHKQKLGRGARPCIHLDLGLLASRAVRKWIFVVYATQFVVLCYGSRRKRTPIGSSSFVFPFLLFYAWYQTTCVLYSLQLLWLYVGLLSIGTRNRKLWMEQRQEYRLGKGQKSKFSDPPQT